MDDAVSSVSASPPRFNRNTRFMVKLIAVLSISNLVVQLVLTGLSFSIGHTTRADLIAEPVMQLCALWFLTSGASLVRRWSTVALLTAAFSFLLQSAILLGYNAYSCCSPSLYPSSAGLFSFDLLSPILYRVNFIIVVPYCVAILLIFTLALAAVAREHRQGHCW